MNPFLHSLGKEAVEPAEELETTPEEVLRKLSESLADKIFHIEKELQLLQQKHLVLWEICCAPNSTLTEEMIRNGFQSVRWNYESQFDLEKMDCVQKAIEAIPAQRPSKIWASLTEISPNFYIRLGLVCWLLREKVIGFTVKQRLW